MEKETMRPVKRHCFRVSYRTWFEADLSSVKSLSTVATDRRVAADKIRSFVVDRDAVFEAEIEITNVEWVEEIDVA